jgi:hypothetical protein
VGGGTSDQIDEAIVESDGAPGRSGLTCRVRAWTPAHRPRKACEEQKTQSKDQTQRQKAQSQL